MFTVRFHPGNGGGRNRSLLAIFRHLRTEAVENINSIIEASDVIMVARGDLGVEMGYAELIGIQKKLIRKTRKAHKIVDENIDVG